VLAGYSSFNYAGFDTLFYYFEITYVISININLFWLPGKLSNNQLISNNYLVDYEPVIRFLNYYYYYYNFVY
jgi:hypothetical protein